MPHLKFEFCVQFWMFFSSVFSYSIGVALPLFSSNYVLTTQNKTRVGLQWRNREVVGEADLQGHLLRLLCTLLPISFFFFDSQFFYLCHVVMYLILSQVQVIQLKYMILE